MLISVIICTHNRARLLANALTTICEQTLDCTEYEVIVVDNHSSDDTAAVTHSFAARYPNVHYCFEPQQGLSHARNRGWREAKGAYVAYIDDDCKVPPEWLTVAKELINAVSPGILGGPALAFYDTPKPAWFQDSYESHIQQQSAGPLEPDQYISGMNMLFDKALLGRIGGFDPDLGMLGEQLAYGEESAVLRFVRTQLPQTPIYVEPRFYVYHLVRPGKMTWRWIMRDRFVRGRYEYRVYAQDQALPLGRSGLILKGLAIIVVFAVDALRGILWRNRNRYPFIQNHLYESSLRYLFALGRTYEQFCRSTAQNEALRT